MSKMPPESRGEEVGSPAMKEKGIPTPSPVSTEGMSEADKALVAMGYNPVRNLRTDD
jgi:hypothetical protein